MKYLTIITAYPLRLLLLAVVAVFSTGLAGDFVNDDRTYFIDNDLLPSVKPWEIHRLVLQRTNYWGEHLPVRDFFYSVQYFLFDENPFGYHVVSLLLYVAIIYCSYNVIAFLVQKSQCEFLSQGQSNILIFLCLSIFAFHPAHVESVVYVSGQKDLLCVLFSLLAIWLSFVYLSNGNKSECKTLFTLVLTYYAAHLSKNLAVGTGIFMTISTWFLFRDMQGFYRRWFVKWLLINLPVLFWLIYSLQLGSAIWGQMNQLLQLEFVTRICRSVQILGWHYKLALWPHPLNFGYPFDNSQMIDMYFFIGILGTASLCVLFFLCKDVLLRTGVLLIFSFFLPVVQLFSTFQNAAVFDRYLFVPILGLAMVFTGLISSLGWSEHRCNWLKSIGSVLVVCLLLKTVMYIPVYDNKLSVEKHAYETYPDWNVTSFNYMYALLENGELPTARKLLSEEPLLNNPPWVYDYFSGWILLEERDLESAIPILRKSFWRGIAGGYYPFAGIPLARALIENGDYNEARLILNSVLKTKIYNPLEFYKTKIILDKLLEVGS